jgi:hypothetical protein
MQPYETTIACRDIYRAGSDGVQPMAEQPWFEQQCENHGRPTRKLHQRGAVFCNKIFVVRGVKPREIHTRMIPQYGGNCMNERKVYQWVERFHSRRPNICSWWISLPGCPCTAFSDANVAHLDTLIGENSQQRKVQHHAGRETEACNLQSSSRTSVRRHPPSSLQCATTHCCCNSYHHPEIEIWGHKSSPLQSRPSSIRLSCVWPA